MAALNAIVWFFAAITLGATALVLMKPTPPPTPVPDDATTIGPGYMRVWATDRRISMRFRNSPSITISFDRQAAAEFGEWLKTLPEVTA